MKEWEKHLERAEEKLKSAHILFDNNMFADSVSESYYSMYHAAVEKSEIFWASKSKILKAKALLSLKNVYSRTHAGPVSQFGLNFVIEGFIEEFYAKSLAKAETGREKANYDVFYVVFKNEKQ